MSEDEGLPEISVQPEMRARDSYPLRGTSIRYQDPMEPVAEQEWEATAKPAQNKPRAESRTHWERMDALGDAGIDTSDIPALTEDELANAEWRLPAGFQKGTAPPLVVEVAVDPDVLAWFQSQGQDYPVRMRAALRLYAEAHQAPA